MNLSLVHDNRQAPSFHSARWKKGYNPDLVFASNNICRNVQKKVLKPIPGSQHRPISIEFSSVIDAPSVSFKRRFNFKKANWKEYQNMVDEGLKFEPTRKNYDLFIKTIMKAARKTLPRGCRTKHIPGLTKKLRTLCDEYHQSFEEDPFSAVTLKKGEHLATAISEARHVNWIEFIE